MRDPRWIENQLIEKLTKESSGDDLFDEKVVATWQKFKPNPDDFEDVYGRAEIATDKKYVEEREKEFEKESREATRLYYSTMDSIETHNWFGQDCMVVPASRYDDIKNGVDFVLCFTQEEGPSVKMGIDITASEDKIELSNKLEASSARLRHGEPPRAKYFQLDQESEPRGQIELPRLVVGANKENINLLFKDIKSVLEEKEKGKLIERNDLQHQFLQEMLAQLGYYVEFTVEIFVQEHKSSSNKTVDLLISHLNSISPMDMEAELTSNEFFQLLKDLEKQRETLLTINPQLAKNIFLYLDAFRVIEDLVKKKGSDKASFGAEDSTIDFLKQPKAAA